MSNSTLTGIESVYPAQFRSVNGLRQYISSLSMRDKRCLFYLVRAERPTPNAFFPSYGVFAGQFAVQQVLSEPRKTSSSSSSARRAPQKSRKAAAASSTPGAISKLMRPRTRAAVKKAK